MSACTARVYCSIILAAEVFVPVAGDLLRMECPMPYAELVGHTYQSTRKARHELLRLGHLSSRERTQEWHSLTVMRKGLIHRSDNTRSEMRRYLARLPTSYERLSISPSNHRPFNSAGRCVIRKQVLLFRSSFIAPLREKCV